MRGIEKEQNKGAAVNSATDDGGSTRSLGSFRIPEGFRKSLTPTRGGGGGGLQPQSEITQQSLLCKQGLEPALASATLWDFPYTAVL